MAPKPDLARCAWRKWPIAAALLAGWLGIALTARAAPPEYELKAAFIARFTEFIDWPPAPPDAPFEICVLGASPIEEPLGKLPALMTAKGRPLRVQRIEGPANAANCEILFVPREQSDRLSAVAKGVRGRPVLTVSDGPGETGDDAQVTFYKEGNQLRLTINLRAADQSGLRFSSRLLKIAKVMN
jgi:hypothetical protein